MKRGRIRSRKFLKERTDAVLREAGRGNASLVLFGSRAGSRARAGSDYDLLVIVERDMTPEERIGLISRLRSRFAEEAVDADVIVKSRREVEYYRDKIGHVVRSALREGVLL